MIPPRILILGFCFWQCGLGTETNRSPILLVPSLLSNYLEAKHDYQPCTTDHSAHCDRQDSAESCDADQHQEGLANCKVCADASNEWHSVWLPSDEQLSPEMLDCWKYELGLTFQDGEYKYNKNVKITLPGFGDTTLAEFVGKSPIVYMNHMVELFLKHGYVRGVSIRAAAYDWRLSPDILAKFGYFSNVKQLIETMYKENDDSAITIVTHCLGATNMLYFLTNTVSQQWKDKHIKAFVTLASVWKGSVVAMTSVISGNTMGIPDVNPLDMRSVLRTWPAIYQLFPVMDEDVWSRDQIVVETPSKNYTMNDFEELFTDIGYPQGYDQYMANPLNLVALPPPNVPVYCYYGSELDTPMRLVYDDQFPNSEPTFVMGTGDAVADDTSLQACAIWKRLQNQPAVTRSFPGVPHHGPIMLTTPELLETVLDITKL